MFSAIVLTGECGPAEAIERLAVDSGLVSVLRTLTHLPQAYELARLLNSYAPEIVFLDLSDWEAARPLAAEIVSRAPTTVVIGFGAGGQIESTEQLVQEDITELFDAPVTREQFERCIEKGAHRKRGAIQENLLAFLPAKAGSGCTTVALNSAGWLATSLGRKVLLIEADLHSGVLSILLHTTPSQSLGDALLNADQLDYSRWEQLVVRALGVDCLLASQPGRPPLFSWSHYYRLLDFAAPRYDFVLVDLPEVVNDATAEVVRRAKSVFVVSTPELLSLRLVRRRCEQLGNRGVAPKRIFMLLNRWHEAEVQVDEMERFLEHPISGVFRNDYPQVHSAILESRLVKEDTELGRSFIAFANRLAGLPVPPAVAERPSTSKLGFLRRLGGGRP